GAPRADLRKPSAAVDPPRRGAPDARVRVFARERRDGHAILVSDRPLAILTNGGEPDVGICGFVLGLDLETVEERHAGSLTMWKSGDVEIWKSSVRFPHFQVFQISTSTTVIQPSANRRSARASRRGRRSSGPASGRAAAASYILHAGSVS